MICGCERVGITEADERAMLWAVDQSQRGAEHDRKRPFGSDQRTRNMESIFRKQLVEVVAGYAAWNLRETAADARGIAIADRSQGRVNLSAAPPFANNRVELVLRCRADRSEE